MIEALVGVLTAAGLFSIGLWGRRNATQLVTRSLSLTRRRRKERQLRHGAMILMGLAVAIVIGVVFRLVSSAIIG
jgi:hypothetical protein